MRERILAPLALLLVVACKSGGSDGAAVPGASAPEAAAPKSPAQGVEPGPATAEAPAPPVAAEPSAEGTVPPAPSENAPSADGRRGALETAWRARACLLKRQDRTGADAIDKAGGFKDAADFTAQWAAAAAADPAWATRVMTEAVTADCQPASN
ncbi:MAG: hypothetical protein IV100_15345 [Myxococcales bacterium]|nr:hypothetical protein [Myxococcales bacterium]